MARGSARTTTRRSTGYLRYSRGDNRNGFSVTGMGYWADWDSTDQVAQRADHQRMRFSRFGHLDLNRRWASESPESRRRIPAIGGAVLSPGTALRAAQQPQPVLELHLLPGRSGARRSVRAGRTAHGGRWARDLPAARPLLRTAHRECDRCATPERLALSRRAVSHRGASTAVDDARGRGRPDDGQRVCADGDRMDAHAADDVWPARRRVSVLRDVGQFAELG